MTVTLNPDERELLHQEVAAFLAVVESPEARHRYQQLAAEVDAGQVSDASLPALGGLLEIGLQTGRIRKLHRAPGEQALLRLFAKTPAGAARAEATGDLNRALAQLEGQTIEKATVYTRTPGVYLLNISTDGCEISLRFSPDGAGVEGVAVGV